MSKNGCLSVVSAVGIGLALTLSQPTQIEDFQPKVVEDAIVRVTCDVAGGRSVGTASHVGNGVYTTADHVVDQGTCTVKGQAIYNIKSDKVHDFATFAGPVLKDRVKFTCRNFRSGRHYLAVGYPGRLSFQVMEAWNSTPFQLAGYRVFVGNGYPGMSGGPVLDKNGHMTGIVNMRWPTRSMPLRSTHLCDKD